MFFGIMGMIAYANDPVSYDNFEKYSYLAFFDLLVPLGNGWHIVVLIFITALCASSLDSLQNGLNSIFYRDALRAGFNAHITASVLVVLMNVPAIWLASLKFNVLGLFLVADLVCATAVLPTFLGLQTTDKLGGWLPAPTELGAFLGILSGMACVLINGEINGAHGFGYFWLPNDAICALCGVETMISFIVTPLVAGFMTYVFSHLDLFIRGKERARRPVFEFAFDKDIVDADADADIVKDDNDETAAAAADSKGDGVDAPEKALDEKEGDTERGSSTLPELDPPLVVVTVVDDDSKKKEDETRPEQPTVEEA